jgi:tetratricopeptide (TPR) repeat protein
MPEKPLNEIPRPLREQFDRGMAAYNKDNLDYAIALFASVLQKEPAFYDCREALRAAQFRRGGRGGLFKRLLHQASPSLAKGQLALRTNPVEALHHAEQVLNDDPRSAAAHELLARAAMASDLPRTAVLSLEIVFKNSPGNRDVGLKLGKAYVAAGMPERADRLYADLLAANPSDLEVAQAYKDLGARRTLSDKGYAAIASGEGTYRDALRDKEEAVSLEQQNRHVKGDEVADRLLAEYEARLAIEPDNLKLLRNIADLHVQKQEYERALETYQRLVTAEGRNDPSLEKVIAETRLRLFDRKIAQLDPTDPAYSEQKARLEQERNEFQLEECLARMERYPTDLAIRFELGQLYFRAGRITEAIQELQKAQANPHRRVAALALLARCFAKRGMNDLASRTLQNAIREKPVFDDEKKDLIYELGCVHEAMGRNDEAVEQFKLIYETDISYRDVAAKVDAYYASRSGG